MNTMAPPTPPPTPPRPWVALGRAGYLEIRHHAALPATGIAVAIAIPLTTFYIGASDGGATAELSATTFEMFGLLALLFVQFPSVFATVTTRRDPAAPLVAGTLLCAFGAGLLAGAMYGAGTPAPVNPLGLALALVAGTATFSVLALVTSALTKSSEAVPLAALAVVALAVVGISSIRSVLPDDGIGRFLELTPFAAMSDLVSLGAEGRLAVVSDSAAGLDFVGTFAQMGAPVATLAAWSVLGVLLTVAMRPSESS